MFNPDVSYAEMVKLVQLVEGGDDEAARVLGRLVATDALEVREALRLAKPPFDGEAAEANWWRNAFLSRVQFFRDGRPAPFTVGMSLMGSTIRVDMVSRAAGQDPRPKVDVDYSKNPYYSRESANKIMNSIRPALMQAHDALKQIGLAHKARVFIQVDVPWETSSAFKDSALPEPVSFKEMVDVYPEGRSFMSDLATERAKDEAIKKAIKEG